MAMRPRAARVAMDYAFTVLRWPRAISLIDPDNTRSAAVAVRLGSRKTPERFTFKTHVLDIYAQDNPAR